MYKSYTPSLSLSLSDIISFAFSLSPLTVRAIPLEQIHVIYRTCANHAAALLLEEVSDIDSPARSQSHSSTPSSWHADLKLRIVYSVADMC